MFTGIIEARGKIKGMEPRGAFVRIRIASDLDLTDVKEGDSISVNGACLTATAIDSSRIRIHRGCLSGNPAGNNSR